jgi:uncharacterized membrane protein YjjP (DUF1212 family)
MNYIYIFEYVDENLMIVCNVNFFSTLVSFYTDYYLNEIKRLLMERIAFFISFSLCISTLFIIKMRNWLVFPRF